MKIRLDFAVLEIPETRIYRKISEKYMEYMF